MSIQELSQSKKALLAKLASGRSPTNKIPKRSDPFFAPLSFAQQRLWFLEQFTPGSSVYNMHDAVRIRGLIDPQLLQKVLSRIVLRHEALRTTFIFVNGEPLQKISPPQEIHLAIEEVVSEERAQEIAKEETVRPFDLEKGPLFRVRLIRISDEDHILLWTMHHMVSDGWSLGLIIKEVMTLFEALSQNLPDPLPELPIQYGDFSVWQKQWLTGTVLEKQISYWRKELEGNYPPLKLPFDHPRPPLLTNRGKRKVTYYPSDLMDKLTRLSLKEDTTLFMVLLAAWDLLLYRYSGMDVLFVGVPVANRNKSELSDLIGFFANTLVIRAELHPDLKFLDLLKQIKEKAYAAYEHQDIPFERLVEILQPQRELNTSAFFQVMFVLQNQPMPKVEQPGLKIEPIEIHNDTCKFDLLLNIYENQIGIEYSTDLFDEETIERILEHYRIVLEALVMDPHRSVSEMPIMSQSERQKILHDWNASKDATLNLKKTLSQYVEEQVDRTPQKIAITDEKNSLTYEELNAKANQLAHKLVNVGVGPGVIVPVYMHRCIEQAVSFLAILKAGGAFLPLDVEYPEERLSFMIKDSQATLLLYKAALPDWFNQFDLLTIDINGSLSEKFSNIPSRANAEDLAYVIYTSGTTGKPNGAMIPHRGICNRLLWMQKEYNLHSDDKILQKTSCSFDVSMWEFFWPLTTGAELIIAPPEIHRNPVDLSRCIQQYKITIVHFVPSMLTLFLSQIESCPSLRQVFCSGETLSYELAKRFQQLCKAKLHNLYGPTETSIDVTFWDCAEKTDKKVIPIGRPIANTQIYILDTKLEPVPIGICGELYIGGEGVGLGYLNRSELTEKKFLSDPFCIDKKMYKTGDLARFWKNGVIEFLGRIDHQIKIRGVRIELEEIEQALLENEHVGESLVISREDTPGDQRIVAYVVNKGTRLNEKERVDSWETVFEDTYLTSQTTSPLMNTIGWNSSYTGEPLSSEEMEEWIDDKVERIRRLKPKKILEIGCGTGMLLFRLAEQCALYVGTDISKAALDLISQALPQSTIDPNKIKLFHCPALDFSPFQNEKFDVIILNSVVQYFPSLDYFLEIINNASLILTESGSIFLGDLRNYALMDSFYTSVILQGAEGEMTIEELRKKIQHKKDQERELFLDPELFHQLDKLNAETFLQRGTHKNEMTLFRYNTLLSCEKSSEKKKSTNLQKFANNPFDLKQQERTLKQFLRKKLPEYLIPNHILFLDRFPLSHNGKIARQSLPLPTLQTIQPKISSSFQTPLEKMVGEVWSELLGITQISNGDNFFDLGGHSLLAAQVVLKLNQRLGKEIPLRLLFQFPTIYEFAKNIESNQDSLHAERTWSQMLKDSFLPPSIIAKEREPKLITNPKNIFLTGATGFLGAYLLKDLLFYTQATIYCLVRAEDAQSGLSRIKNNLHFYHLTEEIDFNRIVIIPGDLEKESFGLDEKNYTFLTQEIEMIYHCGANVHFAASYDELRAANVLGTSEILRLAAKERTKVVHHISTIYTLTEEDQKTATSLSELHNPSHGQGLKMGYLQSKWVSERLALAARERKIPVSIYRVGRVGGDTRLGACQISDFYWGLIRACIKLGKIPESGFDENLIPVDSASHSIIQLALSSNNPPSTYHILHSEKLSGLTLIESLRSKGYKLETCSFEEWKKAILDQIQKDPDDPASTLAGFLSDSWNENEPQFSSRLTSQKMEKLGITLPYPDAHWIQKTVDFFIQKGFFPSNLQEKRE